MNINILLQAISNKTDIAIEYRSENEILINYQIIVITDTLLKFNDCSISLASDPLYSLTELQKQGTLAVDDQTINEILKAYHKLQR